MLNIDCPWCGPRAEIEFRCGGQSHVIRPAAPESVDDETWGRYLSERINPKGVHLERWLHRAGCRRWFNIARDTATHEIKAVYRMDEAAPVLPRATAGARS
jgi:heterotetrameric sarcosine oxidase delta subunit